MFADLASATLKQVADWFVWLASTLGKFNATELRRADNEVHDIADGRYDGRIQVPARDVKMKIFYRQKNGGCTNFIRYIPDFIMCV